MKKKLILLLICTILSLSLFLSACGDDSNNQGQSDNENDIQFMTADAIANQFTEGKFTLKLTSEGQVSYYTIICNEEGTFYAFYDTPKTVLDGMLYIKDGATYKYYEINDGKREFVMSYTNDEQANTLIGGLFTSYLASYASLSSAEFSLSGATTVAGRACKKYLFRSSVVGNSVSYEYYIDDSTGICLKYSVAVVSGGQTGSASWEITQITLGNVSLEPYSALPLKEGSGGIVSGNSAVWPKQIISDLATYITDTTVPELSGATNHSYMSSSSGLMITASGITTAEYNAYDALFSSYYEDYSDLGKAYSKLLSGGNMISVILTYTQEDEELLILITAIDTAEAKAILPQNYKLVYTNDSDTTYTSMKIGNDFYREYTDTGITYCTYAKFVSDNSWEIYNKSESDWVKESYTLNLSQVKSDFIDSVDYGTLSNVTFIGTETVSGQTCNKFEETSDTSKYTYWKTYNNMIFKIVEEIEGAQNIIFEVTLYSTDVTSFGITLPS